MLLSFYKELKGVRSEKTSTCYRQTLVIQQSIRFLRDFKSNKIEPKIMSVTDLIVSVYILCSLDLATGI